MAGYVGEGGARVPMVGQSLSILLTMITVAALSACITQRLGTIKAWRSLTYSSWLLILIYLDSFAFVFVTGLLSDGLEMNYYLNICRGAILLCLICYMTTKVLLFLFLIEKIYIVRGTREQRLKSKWYLFNCLGMLSPYVGVFILNFFYRIAYLDKKGMCVIGMRKVAMIPLVTLEVIVNVSLTSQFLFPLRKLNNASSHASFALRKIARRTFIGSCWTLASSVANLTVLMVLEGEPSWVCMMCCNADILFSVLVLHWVTSNDSKQAPRPSNKAMKPKKQPQTLGPSHLPDWTDKPFDGANDDTFYARYPYAYGMNQYMTRPHKSENGDGPRGMRNSVSMSGVTTHIEATYSHSSGGSSDKGHFRVSQSGGTLPGDSIFVHTQQTTHVELEHQLSHWDGPGTHDDGSSAAVSGDYTSNSVSKKDGGGDNRAYVEPELLNMYSASTDNIVALK